MLFLPQMTAVFAAVCVRENAHVLRSRPIHRRLPRDAGARSAAPPAASRCSQNLERLLGNQDFIASIAATSSRHGVKVLYEDPKLGFQVLAHIYDKARVSPPHDHGASWAIYGQANQMDRHDRMGSARTTAAIAKHAKLKPVKKYRLNPGEAGIYQDGTIHSIDYPDYARFIRVTGTDLDKIDRIKIDLEDRCVEQMYTGAATIALP